MAVTTWTQPAVLDLLQKFQTRRLIGYRPRAEELANEAHISLTALLGTLQGSFRLGAEIVTVERYRWRNPYTTKDPWTRPWDELVAAGLGERAGEGWRVTPLGRGLAERLTREIRAYLESLRVPPVDLRRATKALTDLADAMPAWAERAQAVRRGILLRDRVRSDIVRLDVAVHEIWVVRDDAHIAAWQYAGYSGPILDALSQVWEGKATVADAATALEAKQERADVERCLEELVRRGDLARDGDDLALTPQGRRRRDDIEADTDRRYFVGWPTGEALARLGDDLSAILAALP